MIEEVFVTVRSNPRIDPVLSTWSWEVPAYLFLGGLVGGIIALSALMIILGRDRDTPIMSHKLVLWSPILLSIGMGALFLDLSHKFYVYRFYTHFNPTSPMSWGAWILVVIYPVCLLQVLSTLRAGYPGLSGWCERFAWFGKLLDTAQRYRRAIAWSSLPFGLALGLYTGILLNTFVARPFWNSGLLPPLFLISGLSSAAALAILVSTKTSERHLFSRIDVGLIAIEICLIGLFVINLATGSQVQIESVNSILGGQHTLAFWGFFFTLGLLLPLSLEGAEILSSKQRFLYFGPLLVIFGGYLLRQLMMTIGLHSSWLNYAQQFDPQLLELLR